MSMVASGAARKDIAPPQKLHDDLAGRRLLDGLTLDFGPTDLLGRFFLQADAALRERGIEISFGTLDELVAVNRQNSASWRPLVTVFDPSFGGIDRANSFVMLGRNPSGQIVATQAARLYNWATTNLADEASSLGLFYPSPVEQRLPDERIDVTAPTACQVNGRVAYSGGVWVHPDYRGRWLTAIMPRMSRAFAFSRWYTDLTTTLMAEQLVEKGLADRCGYRDIDWDMTLRNTRLGTFRCALLKMQTNEMLEDLAGFSKQFGPKVDRLIEYRTG